MTSPSMSEHELADFIAGTGNGKGGWLPWYIEHARSITDAPSMFHVGAGLTAMAGAIGSNVTWAGGGRTNWPNLYVLLIAPSGLYRKSTAVDIAMTLLNNASPESIMDREFSPERFIRNLASNPSCVLKETEFGSLLERVQSGYMTGLKERLTDLYDCHEKYTRALGGSNTNAERITIDRPALSVLGASTVDWLVEKLTATDFRSGFMPRFLFFEGNERESEPDGGYLAQPNAGIVQGLSNHLREFRRLTGTIDFSRVRGPAAAWAAEHRYVVETEHVPDELLGLYSRLSHHLAKVMALLVCSEQMLPRGGTMVATEDVFERARALVDWVLMCTRRLFDRKIVFSEFERKVQRVLAMVEREGGNIGWSDLLRRSRVSSIELDRIVGTIIQRGELQRYSEATNGRIGTRLRLVAPDDGTGIDGGLEMTNGTVTAH